MSIENLRNTFDRATQHDVKTALNSYPRYNRLTGSIAQKYGFNARTGHAVFACLSPNNDFYGNLRDTDKLLAAAAQDLTLDGFTVSTYGNNKRKAWEIVHGAEPLDLIVADKTRNFFLNVNDPSDPIPVTIDGHMVNIWRGKRENLVGLRFSDKMYPVIADAVRQFAADTGYLPCVMQGIVWHAWRRLHGIKSTAQLELWDCEYLAANLGWVLA